MPLEVRLADSRDFPKIWQLLEAKARFDGGRELLTASRREVEDALFGGNPKVQALVAIADGVPVGLATYFASFSTFLAKPCLWLDDLFVDEAYRSCGIGRMLMTKLAEQARIGGMARIDWTLASGNTKAASFYESVGATIRTSTLSARLNADAIHRLVDN